MDFDNNEALLRHEVRLFPTVRISSIREAEMRATAGLLAIVKAVSEFGRAVVKSAGGPAGRVSCYVEFPFKADAPDGKEFRPDGIIRSVRAGNDWRALVEVKVGDNPLDQDQVTEYHRLAKEHGFSALITISNQAAQADGLPPLNLDGRRLRSVPVVHFSWHRLLSEARLLSQQAQVSDPDQAWMLDEWIRYVSNHDSRIIEPPQLGERWSEILRAAREASLPSVAKYVDDLVTAWDAYLRKEALRLRARLGVDVEPRIPRSERKDPASRAHRMSQEVLSEGCLRGEIRIPDAAGDISVEVGLAAKTVRFGVELAAPQEGRQQTRLNWLGRQLRDDRVPEDLVVKVDWDRKNLWSQGDAAKVQQDTSCLLRDGQQQQIPADANPRRFLLEWTRKLQKPKGRSTVRVLEGISRDLEAFYGRVVEGLVAYVAPAPKLPSGKHLDDSIALAEEPIAAASKPADVHPEVRDPPERETSPDESDAALGG